MAEDQIEPGGSAPVDAPPETETAPIESVAPAGEARSVVPKDKRKWPRADVIAAAALGVSVVGVLVAALSMPIIDRTLNKTPVETPPVSAVKAVQPEPAPPPSIDEDSELDEQYARLHGAAQVPILMQLQTSRSVDCNFDDEDFCNMPGEQAHYAGLSRKEQAKRNVQGGKFTKEIGVFWQTSWPYPNSRPVDTPLWDQFASDGQTSIKATDLLLPAAQKNCYDVELREYQYDESDDWPRYQKACAGIDFKKLNDSMGFLFWVFSNKLNKRIKNVSFTFVTFPKTTTVDQYKSLLVNKAKATSTITQTMPVMNKNESIIVLLSVYQTAPDYFEKQFLYDGMIPQKIEYDDFQGHHYVYAARDIKREKAMRIKVPYGWYGQ